MPAGVFNPTDFLSSKIFAEFIQSLGSLHGKTVLDMGSGSGVVSIFAAAGGADCVAVDINPNAVTAVKQNAESNNLSSKIKAVESDLFRNEFFTLPSPNEGLLSLLKGNITDKNNSFILFSPMSMNQGLKHIELTPGNYANDNAGEKSSANENNKKEIAGSEFDIMFFNPPYYKGEPKNDLERAFKGGNELEVITRFLTDAKNYLKPTGEIYFIVSSDMDSTDMSLKWLENAFVNNRYKHQIIKEIRRFFETFYIIKLVVNFE